MGIEDIVVYVSCKTFNQARYIKDTLDGFCMQQTNFPFLCGIFDDASTDDEPQIIQHYLEENFDLNDTAVVAKDENDDYIRVFAQHKTNKNCFFIVIFLKYNHYQLKKDKDHYVAEWSNKAKYIALCEGDDYWMDPLKIQKQVLCLETHPTSVLCYTGFEVVNENNEKTNNRYRPLICHSGNVFDELLKTNFIQTVTILVKMQDFISANKKMNQRGAKYDYGLFLELSLMGDFHYIEDKTAVYRICEESASHSSSLKKELEFAKALNKVNKIYHDLKYRQEGSIRILYKSIKLFLIVTVKHYLSKIIGFKH